MNIVFDIIYLTIERGVNMKKYSKIICLLVLFASFCFINNVKAVYSDKEVGTYEEELAKFPIAYQEKIKKLHDIYPNAIFVKQDKFLLWGVCPSNLKGDACTKWKEENSKNFYKEIPVSWNDMVEAEVGDKSLIWHTAKSEYKGKVFNAEGTWYYATKLAVEYYMNPYNFLDETHVFMFQSQYYNPAETEAGVNGILSDAYKNKECPGADGKTYAQAILQIAKDNNISAYMLASRLRQENPKGTEALVAGRCLTDEENCTKYYNLYNIQATGSNDSTVISNGIKCASGTLTSSKGTKLCNGYNWTSPYLSIVGAAKFMYKGYIGANDTYNVKGQMTNYLQKWDPYGPNLGGHQYMQNIQAPYTESTTTYKSNIEYIGKNFKYIFYIPIFTGAPNTENVYSLGDLNGDGEIDKNDLLLEQSNVFGYMKFDYNQIKSGDVNIDGKVDKNDLLLIQSYVFGYIKSF